MKLGVVSLMRNEADIAPVFLRHLAALFDYAVLMDHHSTDGTARMLHEVCAARPGWTTWQVAIAGFHQDAFTGFATRWLFGHSDADYVALLDADEFLDVADRASLACALAPLTANPRAVGHLPWRNAVPVHPHRSLRPASAVWLAQAQSTHCKTVLPRRLFDASGGRAAPGFGNHAIEPGDGGPVDYHRIGQIIHLPIRSMRQLKQKVLCGTLGLLARPGTQAPDITQWSALLDQIGRGELHAHHLPRLALAYGDTAAMAQPPATPKQLGCTRRSLRSLAQHRCGATAPPQDPDPMDAVAAAIASLGGPADAMPLTLRLHGTVLDRA